MASKIKSFTPRGVAISVVFTTIIAGLSYWLWQDVAPVLRPLRGDGWGFLKDLRFIVNLGSVLALVTIASLVFDNDESVSRLKRVIFLIIIVFLSLYLVREGRFFKQKIEPVLSEIGFERPPFLKRGK